MPQLNNPMDILKILDKSNCRKCDEATCLAFAAAVARGKRALDDGRFCCLYFLGICWNYSLQLCGLFCFAVALICITFKK